MSAAEWITPQASPVGLVPPPRQHQVRYFGVFANHHHLRDRIRPELPTAAATARMQLPLFDSAGLVPWQPRNSFPQKQTPSRTRIGWASLLARVFSIDVTVCARCQGPLRILRAVTDADESAALRHGARPPPRPPPADQQLRFAP